MATRNLRLRLLLNGLPLTGVGASFAFGSGTDATLGAGGAVVDGDAVRALGVATPGTDGAATTGVVVLVPVALPVPLRGDTPMLLWKYPGSRTNGMLYP